MHLLASTKKAFLLNFNIWLFLGKGFASLGLVFLLGQQTEPAWGRIAFWYFVILSMLADLILLRFSPVYDFELTDDEARKYKTSTENMRIYLKTSPKVRLIRIGLAFTVWGILGTLSESFLSPLALGCFISLYVPSPILVDRIIRRALYIVTPTYLKLESRPYEPFRSDEWGRLMEDSHNNNPWRPGSRAWLASETAKPIKIIW